MRERELLSILRSDVVNLCVVMAGLDPAIAAMPPGSSGKREISRTRVDARHEAGHGGEE